MLVSPDRYDRERPNLMRLLHEAIEARKPWTAQHGVSYLANAHRLDHETSGVLLLAKDRPALVQLAEFFGNAVPRKSYLALVSGSPPPEFEVDLKLRPDHQDPSRMRWARDGKKALTRFVVREDFGGVAWVECLPETGRTHQIRVHLLAAGFPILGDPLYGGGRRLYLSQLKRGYRPKAGEEERPLTPRLALHAHRLELPHPVTGAPFAAEAPVPRDLEVALKHLRRHPPDGPVTASPPPPR